MKMEQKYVLVEYLWALNDVITQTFQSTKRIKLTSFDVSINYLIFGASSGGIYIFKRDPCQFLKLIPSKEGSASKIVISANEKNVAIASSKGLVIILEDFFVDLNLRYQVYTEHEGQTITAMRWLNDDLYCGDNSGKISVITLMNLLTKAIFQNPTASLMHLESSIVQLDLYSKFLLVSTRTRCYLCDTEKEQFKQIGKKLREGPFGACFFNVPNKPDITDQTHSFRGVFKTIRDDETFSDSLTGDVKVYCARPGARLWEVNFEASVIVTHQFRSSLSQKPSDLLLIDKSTKSRLNISNFFGINCVNESFNFRKIYPVCNRFILTYDCNGIYIFDLSSSSLVFWNNSFRNIKDIVVIGSLIYIWRNRLEINILSLENLEELIINSLLHKQYLLCADLCVSFSDDVLNLIDKSKKIHLISVLKSKLSELQCCELLEKLSTILGKLEKYFNRKNVTKKSNSGIVVVDNAYLTTDNEIVYLSESTSNMNGINDQNNDTTKYNSGLVKKNRQNEKLYKQYKLNKTHENVEIPEVTELLTNTSLNDLVVLLKEFIIHVNNLTDENAKTWCQKQYLKQAVIKTHDLSTLHKDSFTFLEEGFLEINSSPEMACSCSYPLPKAHFNKPKYYNISDILIENSNDFETYLRNIPYLYKVKLNKIDNINDASLTLLIQYSDFDIIKKLLHKFTYDSWDVLLKLLVKMKRNKCLHCGVKIDTEGALSWSTVGSLIVQSVGAQNTTKLLKRYSQFIRNGDLDNYFYQTCILTMITNLPKETVGFMETAVGRGTQNSSLQLGQLMERYLHKKYLGNSLDSQFVVNEGFPAGILQCTHCNLPTNTPIIGNIEKLSCGHSFHKLCLSSLNNICNVCRVIL